MTSTTAGPPRPTGRARRVAAECAIALAFSALALAVRLPAFDTIPRYTDEVREVAPALQVAFEGLRPLVHNDAYRGAHWVYLLAGVFRVVGLRPELPRLFALVLGALTVGATYLLARVLADRRAGVVAALLMTTAFSHVVLNSHVAWANNSTPLWTTLGTALLYLGATGSGLALVLAGGVWGLALSTHPSVLLLLVGAALWFVADRDRRARLRTPAFWVAAGLFLVVLSPMIYFSFTHELAAVTDATRAPQPIERQPGPIAYAVNLTGLLTQLGRMAGTGPVVEPGDPVPNAVVAWTDWLRPALSWVYALVLVGALAWAGWRGPRLLAYLGGAAILALPIVNRSYANFYDTRYIAYVLPLAYAALGVHVAPALRAGGRARVATAVGLAALLIYPLISLGAYYGRETAAGRTNAPLIAAADLAAREATGTGDYVLVDKAMRPIKLGGGGDPTAAFDQLLTLRRVPHTLADTDKLRWYLSASADPTVDYWLIAADVTAGNLGRQYPLQIRQQGDGWVVAVRPAVRPNAP